ncbi:glycosyltransferase [Candidatus Methanoperedens nitroreducens]|uniref:Glycosyltransferase n=1 Tax=Candidatus Methanoperedens nitratireducens TaxID=1392998 RepID=A0A062UZ12_9EURY|nr:glycosyltransferase family 4 protein [Candidatus Methanoperedens nitroreducens]KCZ72171.1 glycosyltransferase [Candidatus Methanoperedens nitroreducens]MDJ1421851.1 glycosyltransferase family 4 protein [Candidatus Methanoperedens sp.]
MKILIIPEYGTFGGTLTFLKRLLYIHNKNNIETAVLIQKNQQIPETMALFKDSGAKVYTSSNRFKLFLHPLFSPIFDLFFCWKAFVSYRPDIIVVSNGSPGTMLSVLFFPVPVIFVMHSYPRKKMLLPIRFMCRMASRYQNRFVTVSQFSKENINRFMGVPLKHIEVIYNSFQPIKTYINNKNAHILTVGHVEWYKDPECWLSVAKKVIDKKQDVRFLWVGDGELLRSFKLKIHELGMESRIVMCGFSNQIENYYADAILYFQPSLLESHGISVVEAMAHGLPCVTSDAGGLPESVVNGETGFTCPPNDVECFVSRIIKLLDDDKLREKMGQCGKLRAEILFSEEVQEKKMISLYTSVLQK